MFATKQSFSVVRPCPVVGQPVTLNGMQLHLADGSTELVRKSCVRFADCYRNTEGDPVTGNIVPIKSCLLGEPER